MSWFDFLTAGNVTDPAAIAGAGDPVMAAIGQGHDYEETLAASAAVDAAEASKGKPLTADEKTAVLANYPAADASIATRPLYRGPRDAALWVADLPGKLLGAVPWWLWLAGGVTLLVALAPYAKFVPVPRRSK